MVKQILCCWRMLLVPLSRPALLCLAPIPLWMGVWAARLTDVSSSLEICSCGVTPVRGMLLELPTRPAVRPKARLHLRLHHSCLLFLPYPALFTQLHVKVLLQYTHPLSPWIQFCYEGTQFSAPPLSGWHRLKILINFRLHSIWY